MEETQNFETPAQFAPAPKKKINKRFLYLIAFIVFLGVAFLGYSVLGSNKTSQSSQISQTPTPTEFIIPSDTPIPTEKVTDTPIPTEEISETPTPKPTQNPVDSSTGLDRSGLTVTVQNGSGQSGVAKTGVDYLTNLGYDVSSPENADKEDYTGVTIQVKSTSNKYLTLLKNDLAKEYTVSVSTSDLADSFSTDALVIIGK
ncbi:MAG: LytR C-terminal domain-containing protein [Patescibacteria group bacterium]